MKRCCQVRASEEINDVHQLVTSVFEDIYIREARRPQPLYRVVDGMTGPEN